MQHLAEHPEARGDAHRLGDAGLRDHVGGLLRAQRGHVVVDLGGRDHRRAHQRHVDGREGDALVGELAARTARPGVQRRLAGDVGREARRVGQHADRADVDDMAPAPGHHARQQSHRDAQAAEVVELHRALEVVEALVAVLDRAPDAAPGVIDQEVDAAVLVDQHLDEAVDIGHVGEVGRVGHELVAARARLGAGLVELVLVAAADDRHRAGLGELVRRRQPDARAAAGDEHDLARDRPLQAAVDEQVGVEVALPVVPQPPGVVVEPGALDAAALERGVERAAVVACRPVQEGEHVLGQAEVLHHGVADAPHRGQCHQALLHALRDEAEQRRVDEQVHLRRMGCLAEDVEHVADPVALRVDEVEGLAPDVGLGVADVVDAADHEVDGDDVDAAALQADRGHPRRQDLPHALDQLEEVVGAVDLVDLSGRAVADDEGRSVDRPGHLALGADDLLALVLRHEVRVLEVLGLVEHVLAEHALVQAGGGDAADVVQVARVDRLGELHEVARALDVDPDLTLLVGTQVVHGGQVVDGVDLALQGLQRIGAHAQAAGRQVAHHWHGARLGAARQAPIGVQRIDLGRVAHQEVHGAALARQQRLDQSLADESRGPGDEIAHRFLPAVGCGGRQA